MQPSTPRDPPIGLLAAQVNRAVRQLVASQVEPLGLSTPQFWALVAIAEQTCSSQSELAARMHVDEATACRVVRSLTDAGWIAAVRDRGDRRRIRLTLAPAGEALVQRTLPVARSLRATIDSALTPDERATIRTGLVKVLARLSALAEAHAAALSRRDVPPTRLAARPGADPPRRRAALPRRGAP